MKFYSETAATGSVFLVADVDGEQRDVMSARGDFVDIDLAYAPLVRQLLIGVLTQDEDTVEAMVPLIEAWDEEDAAQLARALLAVIVEEATPDE